MHVLAISWSLPINRICHNHTPAGRMFAYLGRQVDYSLDRLIQSSFGVWLPQSLGRPRGFGAGLAT